MPKPSWRTRSVIAGASTLVALLASCSNDGGGSTAEFCDRVEADEDDLFGDIGSLDEAQSALERYRNAGEVAPLAVEADWEALALRLEVALEAEDDQEVLARAFASERSALRVAQWLRDNCGLTISVATIVPQATAGAPATAPPATTTAD